MSKVILLNASPRANSNTKIVLEQCAREIEKEGVEAEIISLKGKNVLSCIACGPTDSSLQRLCTLELQEVT